MVHFCRSQTHTSNSHSLFERMWLVNRVNNFAYRFRIWCHYQISDYAYCLWYLLTCKQLTQNTRMNCSYIENIHYKNFYDIYESIKYAFIKPSILYSRGYTLLNLIIFYSCLLSSLYTLPLQIILLPLFAMKIATTTDYVNCA